MLVSAISDGQSGSSRWSSALLIAAENAAPWL
jgi:hypothetical protein